MFCHLKPLRRFCLKKILPHWLHYSRALSGAEAINALRPFYFAVHPDFFGQHPREREINENSLKRLSVYLENLQKPGFKSLKPTQLTFYIREKTAQHSSEGQEPSSTSGFRAVRFTLHTSDLLSTVLYILNSCSLSAEHIQSLNTNVHSQPLKETTGMPGRPIKWHRSYYSFTGFKDPDEDLEQVSRVETTLMSWLGSNGKSAVKKLKNSLPLRKELDRLKSELSELLQLSDISLPNYFDLQRRMSVLEDQISSLLGGIQVVYIEELQPEFTIDEYYSLLNVFYNQLLKSRVPSHPQGLSGLQMILSRLKVIENELIQASTKKFSLEKLYKEPSISSRQMVDCCTVTLPSTPPYSPRPTRLTHRNSGFEAHLLEGYG
ncbi:hypothetical protein H671_4g12881 [Cricetulus griseus]|uniref:T-cell activation inhibitor, mitochondrial n=1 Tax=Cricetulus griseus TaxID=10029 RepID=A0A061I8M9_CRIGR|nr:hypothetical protein H671_4g12881 [Cricetulus griseus]